MKITTALLALLAAGLAAASSACDCIYSFTISGMVSRRTHVGSVGAAVVSSVRRECGAGATC